MPPLAETGCATDAPKTYLSHEFKQGNDVQKQSSGRDVQMFEPETKKGKERQFEVDLSKPLVFQVGHLGDRYDDWVHTPIVSKTGPRLFESDLMEMFTNTQWWVIPLLWLPVAIYAEKSAVSRGVAVERVPLYLLLGVVIWTLLEYCLHRFLFHATTTSYWWNTLHYLLHGCHHKHPQDPYRLVFPPLLNVVVSAAIVAPFMLFLPPHVVMSIYGGGLVGYVCYDVTHFWLHFGVPTRYPLLYRMRRYHLGHHFKSPNVGFGITSDLWDRVFGTWLQVQQGKGEKSS